MLGGITNLRNLAVDLERQLRRSVAGFAGAVEEFHRGVPRDERERLDFLGQMVLRPLEFLDGRPVVRVVLDGLDQVPDGTRCQLCDILNAAPDHLRLVLTAHDDTPECPRGRILRASRTDRAVLGRYLEERGITAKARAAILDRAHEHWLIAQLLADAVVDQPGLDLSRLPGTVHDAYAYRLDQAGAAADWRKRFRPVLGPLTVAGAGPILPLALLVHASGRWADLRMSRECVRSSSPSAGWSRGVIPAHQASTPGCSMPSWPSTCSARKRPRPASQSTPRAPIGPSPGRSTPWPPRLLTRRTTLCTAMPSSAKRTTGGP